MNTAPNSSPQIEEQLSRLFAYKAEWLKEQIFDLFTEPAYLPELTTERPCVLIGGRGTGKTTVLRGLSYQGQYALRRDSAESVPSWPFFGMYYRINTNRVTAFQGPELDEAEWARFFGHYVNIVLCGGLLSFAEWYTLHTGVSLNVPAAACRLVAKALHLPEADSLADLAVRLAEERVGFESAVNNVADLHPYRLSMQAAPVDELAGALISLPPLRGRSLFFLLDEYENLLDYQQQVCNTLLKHSGELYTFKIGVKELGWRRRTTLNSEENLISPADYVRINISEKLSTETFASFARDVCNERLARLNLGEPQSRMTIESLLPGMDAETEAIELGVRSRCEAFLDDIRGSLDAAELSAIAELEPLRQFLIAHWADTHGIKRVDAARDFVADRRRWDTGTSTTNTRSFSAYDLEYPGFASITPGGRRLLTLRQETFGIFWSWWTKAFFCTFARAALLTPPFRLRFKRKRPRMPARRTFQN
jgi:hypothetical protein